MVLGMLIGIFLGFIVDRYLFQIGDIYLQIFSLKKQLAATMIKREISDISEDMNQNVSAIGYQYDNGETCECEEEYEECKNKIGFR